MTKGSFRDDKKKAVIRGILEAVLDRKKIEVCYTFSDNPEGAVLPVLPHKLVAYKESFYLLAVPAYGKKPDFRLYLVDRIKSVSVTKESFTPRDTERYEKRFDDAFGVGVYGEKKTVKVLFDKELSFYLQERIWHPSQRFRETKTGIWIEMDVLVNDEVSAWVRGFGESVKKVEPAELRKMVG